MLNQNQQEAIDAYIEVGSYRGAARKLGKAETTVRQMIKRLERLGQVPWKSSAPTPSHLSVGKTTVQYDSGGNVIQEWRRLSPNIESMQAFVDGLCDKVKEKGKAPVRKSRKTDTDELLFEMDIYDAHVGMYADEKETKDADYDCNIAAARMVAAAEGLASRARRPAKCVLVFGGDMMHSDNRSNKTEASGHVLDVDTRYHRVVEYLIRACTDVVDIAASVAKEVEIVVIEGNHSWHSEVWLARVLDAYYSQCPNINVKSDPSPRKHMVWGDNLLLWAHGDRIAAQKWPMIIAAEFAKEWGQTKWRHLKMGHVHHKKTMAPVIVDEQAGLVVEYLEALCATDAWHSGAGFVGSQKGASAFEYHKTEGLITRYLKSV